MFDEKTLHHALPLPHLTNPLNVDVGRLRDAFAIIDQILKDRGDAVGQPNGLATLDDGGLVPASQLPEMLATGVMMDYALKTLPSDGWRFCDGSALLEDDAKAAALRTKLIADASPYGADGDGNPLLPDSRGRVTAGKDDMGGTASNRLTTAGSGIDGKKLGAAGGAETVTLTQAQIPSHGHTVTDPGHNHAVTDPTHNHGHSDPGHAHGVYDPGHGHTDTLRYGTGTGSGNGIVGNNNGPDADFVNAAGSNIGIYGAATGIANVAAATGISIQSKLTGITLQNTGGGEAHSNTQPTLVTNKIIKL